jgi:hypothetical protein
VIHVAETPYTETEALLAIMNGDREECAALLVGMLDGEVQRYANQVQCLLDTISGDIRRRRLLRYAEARA